MKKMFIILGVLFVFTVQSFAQVAPNGPIAFWSVKKYSTASIYQTDSDFLRATHVFGLKKSMFSAQYSPFGSGGTRQAIQAYMGIAIGEKMYFGLTGAYVPQMTWTKTTPVSGPTTSSAANANDVLVLKPVFRINEMVALEYMFVKYGASTNYNDGTDKSFTNTDKVQAHRLAAAIMIPNAGRLYIPVTLSLYNSDSQDVGVPKSKNDRMNLAIAPEFWLPFKDKGPLAGVNFTASYDMDIIKKNSTSADNKDPSYMNVFVDVYPSLKWTLAEGKIGFGTDPKIRLTFTYEKSGTTKLLPDNETTTMTIAPRLSVPFGTFFKIGEYFEIRGGFQYDFTYTYKTADAKSPAGTRKTVTQTTANTMYVYTGFGINIGTDGSIDFMLRLLNNDPATESKKQLFTLDSVGIQGTYRF